MGAIGGGGGGGGAPETEKYFNYISSSGSRLDIGNYNVTLRNYLQQEDWRQFSRVLEVGGCLGQHGDTLGVSLRAGSAI